MSLLFDFSSTSVVGIPVFFWWALGVSFKAKNQGPTTMKEKKELLSTIKCYLSKLVQSTKKCFALGCELWLLRFSGHYGRTWIDHNENGLLILIK
jgi:hypothetical protein